MRLAEELLQPQLVKFVDLDPLQNILVAKLTQAQLLLPPLRQGTEA